MALPPDFLQYVEFNSSTWKTIKGWLEEKKKTKTELLIGADTHDKSNQIRGALQFINELLALEQAAAQGRTNGN